jgi:hypothetical protein
MGVCHVVGFDEENMYINIHYDVTKPQLFKINY